MRLILNVIWLVLCGWWMALAYVIAGIVCAILIITIPFAIASFRIASYVIWPFGRSVERRREAGCASLIGNVIWIVLVGWELALGHLTAGILLCLTIIGIPLGLANFKLIPISLVPLGVRIVSSDELYPGYRVLARGRTTPLHPLVMEGLRPSIASPRGNAAESTALPAPWPRLEPCGCYLAVTLAHGGEREPGRGIRDHRHF
jgi:uncharacterized membrane protein YccF (DUF307 family)